MDDLASTGQTETFSTMIETAIISTGKFRVIERERLARLMEEQQRAGARVVTSNRPGVVGRFEGVDYLIYGSITGISAVDRQDVGTQLLTGLLSGNNNRAQPTCQNRRVRMEADIRITDTATGDVRYATRISEVQQSATVCGAEGQIDGSSLLRAAADKIATGLATSIYPIQVAAALPDGTLILNYGQGALTAGDLLVVYGPSTEIPDPAGGGRVIRVDGSQIGVVRVTEVQASFSRATRVDQATAPITTGAIARAAGEDVVSRYGRDNRRNRRN